MQSNRGFSLLESAIAMAIMAVGLSGVAAMLIRAVSGTALSTQRATASWLAEGLAAQIKLSAHALPALLDPSPQATDCHLPSACTPRDFAQSNYAAWQSQVAAALPGGVGVVCRDRQPEDGIPAMPACDGAGPYVIKVFWRIPGGTGHHILVVRPP